MYSFYTIMQLVFRFDNWMRWYRTIPAIRYQGYAYTSFYCCHIMQCPTLYVIIIMQCPNHHWMYSYRIILCPRLDSVISSALITWFSALVRSQSFNLLAPHDNMSWYRFKDRIYFDHTMRRPHLDVGWIHWIVSDHIMQYPDWHLRMECSWTT